MTFNTFILLVKRGFITYLPSFFKFNGAVFEMNNLEKIETREHMVDCLDFNFFIQPAHHSQFSTICMLGQINKSRFLISVRLSETKELPYFLFSTSKI